MTPIRVIHVDDEPDFADLTAIHLERERDDFEVVTTTSATEGLEHLAESDLDCIVSDYDMPGMDGLEFLETVREEYPDLPFILFTGRGGEEIASEAIAAGVSEYLNKGSGTDQYTVLANRIDNAVSQYRAERELRSSTERLRKLYGGITDAIFVLDTDWRFTHLNDRAEEIFERTEAEVIGENVWNVFPEAVDTTFQQQYEKAMDQRVPVEFETFYPPLDVWVEVRAVPTEDGLTGHFRDITEKKERERQFEAIFNQTYQLTAILQPDGTTTEINKAALAFGDYDRSAVVGDPFWKSPWFDGIEETEETVKAMIEEAATGTIVRDELTVIGPDDTAITDTSIKPVTDENGDIELLIAEGRKISDRKERKRELERQNEQLDEFASVISHDLRNPLGIAQGYLELARDTGEEDDFERIVEAHDRMEAIIEDVLILARQGKAIGETRLVGLAAVAETAWNTVETDGAELMNGEDLGTIDADDGRLEALFENLFHNAIEHGGEDVTVRVGRSPTGFFIEDDGPGIPESECEQVFEHGHTTSESGTGFGLSIVEQIAEAHGWSVTVGEGADGGARFEVHL